MGFNNGWDGFGAPFSGLLFGAQLLNIVLIALWVVVLVDCARRSFTNDIEKVCWVVAMVVAPLVGTVAYLAVVKYSNPNGIMKKDGSFESFFKKEEPKNPTTTPETPKPTENTPGPLL